MSRLAIDLGTKCGYAWSAADGGVVSGTWDLRPKKFEGGGFRYVKFESFLASLHAAHPIEMVWFEAVRRHAGTDAAHVYGGLLATLIHGEEALLADVVRAFVRLHVSHDDSSSSL